MRDGGTAIASELGVFCRDMPGTLTSTGNVLYVRYYTNVPEPRSGFKAEVKIGKQMYRIGISGKVNHLHVHSIKGKLETIFVFSHLWRNTHWKIRHHQFSRLSGHLRTQFRLLVDNQSSCWELHNCRIS